jgi:hypothetical protein
MGGGGSYGLLAPGGIVAAGTVLNPNYGKMAADSIAKEIEERKIAPATITAQLTTPGEEPAPPATGTEK